jgi:secreted trypsin-like serine protease
MSFCDLTIIVPFSCMHGTTSQGDSGSSMTFETNNGSTVILGVVSWGVGCGRSNTPGVYSSVQYHYHWIAEQVCSDPDTNVTWCSNYSPITPSPSTTPSPSSASPVLSEAPTTTPAISKGSTKETVWK